MVQSANSFLIRKQTFIVKNDRPIDDVYIREKKKLGQGTYGEVSGATHRENGQKRAIKVIPRSKIRNWDRFQTEVKILQQLDHPNVIKLYEYFEDKKNVYLVCELCTGGELFDRIIKEEYFNEEMAARLFKQILQALNYCHTDNIVHRDLKPENFLFVNKDPNSELKIIDFGLSKMLEGGRLQRMNTRAGTPYYISPEVLAGNYDCSCDMWSAGCMLYILLCGYPPFFGDDNNEILASVSTGQFDFDGEEWDDVDNQAKDLIRKLICPPDRRLSAAQALQHPWMLAHAQQNQAARNNALRRLNLGNIKKFHNSERIKQVALMAIAVQSDPNDIRELKEMFQALDIDGNGTVSFEELEQGLGDRENREELIELLRAADTDGSGTINYSEFLAATMDQQMFTRESYLKTAFQMFDKDGSGQIDSNELLELLAGDEFRGMYTQEQLNAAIAEVDVDGNGEIDFNEFMQMMRNAANQ